MPEVLVGEGRKERHNGNPVLNWMMGNMVARKDANENIRPDKEKSSEKIDGGVALIMAFSRALQAVDKGTIYDDRGLVVL